jgi:hypothetical protein
MFEQIKLGAAQEALARSGEFETLPVTDPLLRLVALFQLLSFSEKGAPAGQAGCDVLSKISALSLEDILRLARGLSGASISLAVDLEGLNREMIHHNLVEAAKETFDYFIRAEASIAMMIRLFKTSASLVKSSQAAMGIVPRVGRSKVPDEDLQLDILEEWHRLRDIYPSAKDCYYMLHQRFSQYTLSELDSVVYREQGAKDTMR